MDTEEIRKAVRERPFRPFVFCLVDGREIPVKHAGATLVSPRLIVTADERDWGFLRLKPESIASLRFANE